MIKLALFDIDGTLLSHKTYSIPKSTLQAVAEIKDKGIKIIIATGRGMFTVPDEIIEQIKPEYVISANGQAVYTPKRKLLHAIYLTTEEVESVTKFCLEKNYVVFWKFANRSYIYNGFDILEKWSKGPFSSNTMECCYTRDHHLLEKSVGGSIDGNKESAQEMERMFPTLSFYPYSGLGCDICAKNVDKATGMYYVIDKLGIKPEECIAFGDSYNDLAIIKAAGIGVAMGNAQEELKQNADYVTTDILDDGIKNALTHFKLV